ncbi:CDP-alcohol phosphatidyltransferase family protein [Aquabacterium sp. A7-Y]|uniref:CDP-alcohol phosphatidyltransferase family protein n=1 Tax=Aquabacterium sp. A7-Y TaxID=1349605 RepID=UPI00223DD39D|nr:CDP-alcohol phosphatidyltransferase family protein [Aquabacterium sp. A7-Y]MCW7537534.1 CDP-alcohol phosphatidyltransferase family protein [Aquabacterium sp. A7-Y]
MSIYQLKPRFQALLRPAVRRLAELGVTANQVTLLACAVSVALGLWLYLERPDAAWLALLPLWLLLRMALNAVDGMLAREHGQQSRLGAYLNELTDVVSDAALYLPLAAYAPFDAFWVGLLVLLAALSEMAGVLALTQGASRRYDGPMGKSDRAFVVGALALALALAAPLPAWVGWAVPAMAALTGLTVLRRVAGGLEQAGRPAGGE